MATVKAAQSMGSKVLSGAWKNIKSVGAFGPGGGDYIQAGVKGALTWGAVGGVSEAVQGGSFFEGAKGNLLGGAALGAAGRAINIGATGHSWQKSNLGDIWGGYKGMAGGAGASIVKSSLSSQAAGVVNVANTGYRGAASQTASQASGVAGVTGRRTLSRTNTYKPQSGIMANMHRKTRDNVSPQVKAVHKAMEESQSATLNVIKKKGYTPSALPKARQQSTRRRAR